MCQCTTGNHPQPTGCGVRIGKFFEKTRAGDGHVVRKRSSGSITGGEMTSRQLECAAALRRCTPTTVSVIHFAQIFRTSAGGVAGHTCAGMPDVAVCFQFPGITIAGYPTLAFTAFPADQSCISGDSVGRPGHCSSRQWYSVTAVKDGKSIDTSMGLTPSGGVIMGTRSGDLDPGILVYLMRELTFDAAKLEHMIDHRSGLMGISATSSDMRRLHEASPENHNARLAIDMFCYSVRKQIAAMIAVLDGIDLIVFTGGIGENDGAVRGSICAGLSWAGVSLGPAPSKVLVRVLRSQEDEQIARHTWTISRAS
jgi:acetate kinase